MYLTRHSEMIADVPMDSPIVIFGAGSIGSYTALALAKLGFKNLTICDDGIVEEENIAPQFFRLRDIGKSKVSCLKRSIKELTGIDIIAVPARITYDNHKDLAIYTAISAARISINIFAVDSMEARSDLAQISCDYILDARMAIQFLTIVCACQGVEGDKYYRQTLFTDENAVQEACTNKAISYTSLIAGGLLAKCTLDALKRGWDAEYKQTLHFDINSFDLVRL